MGLRIVVAADIAGYDYKEIIKKDLEQDERVDEVIDVGVSEGETTLYPHVGVAGARVIAEGKADRGIFFCGTGVRLTTAFRSSGSSSPTTPTSCAWASV